MRSPLSLIGSVLLSAARLNINTKLDSTTRCKYEPKPKGSFARVGCILTLKVFSQTLFGLILVEF